MKPLVIIFFFAFIVYGCGQSSDQSAFEGEVKTAKTAAVGTIPDQSLYVLADTFVTQDNKAITLKDLAGKPTVLGMIFTNCNYACPRLTADMKGIEDKLKDLDGKVNYVLVSFDTDRDTPEQLKKYAKSIDLDNRWTLLHGSEEAVRTLSVLLNLQFEKDAEGNFSHSNIISVLDKRGNLVFQKEGLEANHVPTVQTIKDLAAK